MQSLMILNASYIKPPEKAGYSPLQVLRSAAGYYVGTIYVGEDGFKEPGSRDSEYFQIKTDADAYLEMLSQVPNPQEYLRACPDERPIDFL